MGLVAESQWFHPSGFLSLRLSQASHSTCFSADAPLCQDLSVTMQIKRHFLIPPFGNPSGPLLQKWHFEGEKYHMALRKCFSGRWQHQNGHFQFSTNVILISLLFFKVKNSRKILTGDSFQSSHQVSCLSTDTECRQLATVHLVPRSHYGRLPVQVWKQLQEKWAQYLPMSPILTPQPPSPSPRTL